MCGARNTLQADVVVNGGGFTGLYLTMKLGALGFKMVLLEKEEKLAGGASTRNEGWLHCTYHAAAISDRTAALQVAHRSLYGYEQIQRFAPEAVENLGIPAYALVRDTEMLEQATARWDEAGVAYRAVRAKELAGVEPRLRTDRVVGIFATKDASINTRMVYTKALAHALPGARVLCNTEIASCKDNIATLQRPERSCEQLEVQRIRDGKVECHRQDRPFERIEARLFVHTAGYGLGALFRTRLSMALPCRYWKAHLLDLPCALTHGAFYLDKGEATIMHHGAWSIVGATADSLRVADPSDNQPEPTKVVELQQALQRLICISDVDLQRARARACIKVDIIDEAGHSEGPRADGVWPNLNVFYTEPYPNHFLIIPGKMTEVPYVVDQVTQVIFDRLTRDGNHPVALRPIDTY